MAPNENDKAASDLAAEKEKYGFGPIKNGKDVGGSQNLDDDNDDEDLDEDDIEDVDDSDEDTDEDDSTDEDEDDSDEDEDEDEEDEEEASTRKKKVISIDVHNRLRTELRKAQKELQEARENNEKLEAQLPDDFDQQMDELVKEVGVQDPDGLKKIIAFMKGVTEKSTSKLQKEISDLKTQVSDKITVADEFPGEWNSFEKDYLTKEFPNATPEQIKSAKKVMERLSHTKGIGGLEYTDPKSGKQALNPFPLDYIFYKNRKEFEGVVTVKKSKGMETPRTQGIHSKNDDDGEIKHLGKNSSSNDVRSLDKKYSRMETAAFDGIRSPEDNTI